MKLTNLGGATAILEHEGHRMLFDPWLDDGIFHGSWYHYPPVPTRPEDLGRLDYVYISHIHEDHCSAGTLRHIDPSAEILLMDRRPDFVSRFLEAHELHFAKVHHVPPRTPTRVADDLVVDMVTADPAHELNHLIDSGLLLDWDGFTLYNANDCPPYDDGIRYIRDTYGTLDLALLPYAGGSGYPACYTNLSHEEKLAEKHRIRAEFLESFRATTKALAPKRVMPFADQYVVGGSRGHLNQYLSHPAGPGAVAGPYADWGLDAELVLLNSGQSIELETGVRSPDEPFRHTSDAERDAYVRDHLAHVRYEHEGLGGNVAPPVLNLLRVARRRLRAAQEREGWVPDFRFYVCVEGGARFRLDARDDDVVRLADDEAMVEPYLSMTLPAHLLMLVLAGYVSWNIADAALFIDYHRAPNVYDPKAYILLNHLRV